MWYVIDCSDTPRLVVVSTEDEGEADSIAAAFAAAFGKICVKAQGPAPGALVVRQEAQLARGLSSIPLTPTVPGGAEVLVQPRYSADGGRTWHSSSDAAQETTATTQAWAAGRAHAFMLDAQDEGGTLCVCGQYRHHPVHVRPSDSTRQQHA